MPTHVPRTWITALLVSTTAVSLVTRKAIPGYTKLSTQNASTLPFHPDSDKLVAGMTGVLLFLLDADNSECFVSCVVSTKSVDGTFPTEV